MVWPVWDTVQGKKLNEERIPTPGDYKNQEKPQYHIMGERGYWNSKKVLKILENKVYTGTMVNGKYKVTKVGAKKFRRVPDEQLISVPNKHEAIITEQDFQKALEVIKNRRVYCWGNYDAEIAVGVCCGSTVQLYLISPVRLLSLIAVESASMVD